MSNIKCRVLKSVRVAETGNPYGREIVRDTDDEVPAELFDDLKDEGYVAALEPHDLRVPDFAKMKKDELEAVAAEKGIDISAAKTKGEVIALIDAALAEQQA